MGKVTRGTGMEENGKAQVKIRLETPADYRRVEELTREAFWGCMDHPTCDGEHLLVHKLRKSPCYVPQLDFVAEIDGRLVGHVIYSLAKVVTPNGREVEVLSFGPLSVLPGYQKRGVGSALMRHSLAEAKRLGYRAVLVYGHPDYYPRFGFGRAAWYGIVSENGDSFDALMAAQLYGGALDGVGGRFVEDAVYQVDPAETDRFDKTFPPKEPAQLLPAAALLDHLPETVREAFSKRKIRYAASLHRYSGAEMLAWEGIGETELLQINELLIGHGMAPKLFLTSPILQLAKMKVRNPVCTLMRAKDGISLFRVESEGKSYVLKVSEKREDRREIENYRLLAALGVQTLALVAVTEYAILLPDLNTDDTFRLGTGEDLADVRVARALAGWYRKLHDRGREWLADSKTAMYDETDVITPDNMEKVARRTDTAANPLWQEIAAHGDEIRSRIDALPRTLTYNDFYWTNLAVAKDFGQAFMFDYHLLGKGLAYGDIRNVTGALLPEAAAAFREAYGMEGLAAEQKADAFLAPLVTLVFACRQETFPGWAATALSQLKNGTVINALREWLDC